MKYYEIEVERRQTATLLVASNRDEYDTRVVMRAKLKDKTFRDALDWNDELLNVQRPQLMNRIEAMTFIMDEVIV